MRHETVNPHSVEISRAASGVVTFVIVKEYEKDLVLRVVTSLDALKASDWSGEVGV